MGFLSGTPALICIQPCAAHPRNSFLGKCIMTRLERSTTVALVRIFLLRKLWEGKERSIYRATPYIRVCWSNNAFLLEARQTHINWICFPRSIPQCRIDWLLHRAYNFSAKSLSHVARYATSPPRERKSLISIFHITPLTQCEKY